MSRAYPRESAWICCCGFLPMPWVMFALKATPWKGSCHGTDGGGRAGAFAVRL
eukprot:CAMPEP_0180026102 /NCGR_PEP_ID=MMETSP0984-20121128/25009_1 /TAXON_ID=483367 /ORGANISM="non described non described, Strain CCMP 2436" /LENGTH=52 /DNA_ID=CAMNT_0021950777 /DNA_START=397 /DNA_END=555 /DNA_ORIENTATION=-